jgi:hypothetical protein
MSMLGKLDSVNNDKWFDDGDDDSDNFQIDEYDLTATPNDFNVQTIFNYIENSVIKIPSFQRNYVWDIGQASKLIESLILGLPVPQIFLYEEGRNQFLVIDGQQRLLSIYYFIKERFPKKEKRAELRRFFDQHGPEVGKMPINLLEDDNYFSDFRLTLSETLPTEKLPKHSNKFKGLQYTTLADYKFQFDMRPIRNVIVKQNVPKDDDSAVYEIFNRLNSGGINLLPQEIRITLYPSGFHDMLRKINILPEWREVLCQSEPSLHLEDVEILLRSFAMLMDGDNYISPLKRFLNQFAKHCKRHDDAQNRYLEKLFQSFLKNCQKLPESLFFKNNRFNVALFEAVFVAVCREPFQQQKLPKSRLVLTDKIEQLKTDKKFLAASQAGGTMSKTNVKIRLERARQIISTP